MLLLVSWLAVSCAFGRFFCIWLVVMALLEGVALCGHGVAHGELSAQASSPSAAIRTLRTTLSSHLAGPQTPPGVGATASRAEQQAAFTAAEALRTSGQPLQARQAFADFVRRYPDSDLTDDALLALGHISATLEQYAQAVTYYRSLLERFPRSERVPEAHLGLGVALYHRQDYPNSLVALRQYLTLAPTGESRGLARYYLGAIALKQQRYADAIAELKAAVETSRDPAVVQQAREHIATYGACRS